MATRKSNGHGHGFQDLTGQKYGRLTVVSEAPAKDYGYTKTHRWNCVCDCGNETIVAGGKLRSGHTQSCGCLAKEVSSAINLHDLTGQVFGSLTVISRVPNQGNHTRWLCRCECGKMKEVNASALVDGRTRTCRTQVCLSRNGLSRTRIYKIWAKMLDRCYKPSRSNYRFYGAKGTRVCQRWRESLEAFMADLGEPPTAKHTLDRIDCFGHYSCGQCDECRRNNWTANCRWATPDEQHANNRKKRLFTHNGKTMTLKQWAKVLGIAYQLLWMRLNYYNWPVERVLSQPPRPIRRQPNRNYKIRCTTPT